MLLGMWLTEPVNSHGGAMVQGRGITRSTLATCLRSLKFRLPVFSPIRSHTQSQTRTELRGDAHCTTLVARYKSFEIALHFWKPVLACLWVLVFIYLFIFLSYSSFKFCRWQTCSLLSYGREADAVDLWTVLHNSHDGFPSVSVRLLDLCRTLSQSVWYPAASFLYSLLSIPTGSRALQMQECVRSLVFFSKGLHNACHSWLKMLKKCLLSEWMKEWDQ